MGFRNSEFGPACAGPPAGRFRIAETESARPRGAGARPTGSHGCTHRSRGTWPSASCTPYHCNCRLRIGQTDSACNELHALPLRQIRNSKSETTRQYGKRQLPEAAMATPERGGTTGKDIADPASSLDRLGTTPWQLCLSGDRLWIGQRGGRGNREGHCGEGRGVVVSGARSGSSPHKRTQGCAAYSGSWWGPAAMSPLTR